MVYCEKCGTQNPDDAQFCNQCGASLRPAVVHKTRDTGCFGTEERAEEECFGLPYGGVIVGLLVGAIIIIFGLSLIFDWDWSFLWNNYIFAGIVIIVGVLIIIGAIFSLSRRRRY
ncbi:MAG: zinc-ribbon domain-containing protein [Promethearchaeota archaeon]